MRPSLLPSSRNHSRLHQAESKRFSYERVLPVATYSPWNSDEEFRRVYAAISSHTLVDIYRCWEIWTLVQQARKSQGALLEVGVWKGGTGGLIAKSAQLNGIVEPVYLCDTFKGVVKTSAKDTFYKGGEHADSSVETVEGLLLNDLGLDNVRIIQGIFPEETSRFVDCERFRFCHIDVDVYQSAKDALSWVWPRLSQGGIVVYDDYGFHSCAGVTQQVNEQMHEEDRVVFHNLNGHAVLIKVKES